MGLSPHKFASRSDMFVPMDGAAIVLIPVPFEDPTSWIKGAKRSPEAFFEASRHLSHYDIETHTEVVNEGIGLDVSLGENLNAYELVQAVQDRALYFLDQARFITFVGGDHTLSIGAIRAFKQVFENLTVLQLDAHTRLLNEVEFGAGPEASAMREANDTLNLVQVGVRSMRSAEKEVLKRENVFFVRDIRKNPEWMNEAIDHMTRDVYLSFDLNVFDPSVLRCTTQPEPGGLLWDETLKFLRKVSKKRNIVGFEIVGLAPQKDDKSAGIEMARLYHKVLSYIFKSRNK